MASLNPFDLLGDDDTEDPSQLIAAQQKKLPSSQTKKTAAPAAAQQQPSKPPAKLPSKPLPPAQAVREAKAEGGRGRGRDGGRGFGRGRGGGFSRERTDTENAFGNRDSSGGQGYVEEADGGRRRERQSGYSGPHGPFRGGARGGFGEGERTDGEWPRRIFERRSGTGHGNEMKREGAGRGNWGTPTDELVLVTEEVADGEKSFGGEKPSPAEEDKANGSKESPANEAEDKESENKEMTLEEYEKVLEEKRKALQPLKSEERKVDVKEFVSMQQLANKKSNDIVFIKLSSEKEKKKEFVDKEERAKKAVSINEFLKPAEGERYHAPGGRGRGRGRGGRAYTGEDSVSKVEAPAIEDPGQFPTLSVK